MSHVTIGRSCVGFRSPTPQNGYIIGSVQFDLAVILGPCIARLTVT